jgi:hypothetical protein
MTGTIACEECQRLAREEKIAFESWLTQRAVNHQYSLTGKAARQVLEGCRREHERSRARLRLHKGTYHPESGMRTSIHDINLVHGS